MLAPIVIQTILQRVGRGTANNEVLGIQVVTSSSGAPKSCDPVRLYYRNELRYEPISQRRKHGIPGNSGNRLLPIYNSVQHLVHCRELPAFNITGLQGLNPDTNYFLALY